jgi:hypothetical protein
LLLFGSVGAGFRRLIPLSEVDAGHRHGVPPGCVVGTSSPAVSSLLPGESESLSGGLCLYQHPVLITTTGLLAIRDWLYSV